MLFRSLRKPRAIPGGHPGKKKDRPPPGPWAALGRPATAQAGWDAWTKAAEEWLLEEAGVAPEHRGPYRGRGEPVRVQRRRPCPRTCDFLEGEQNGRARAWAVRAGRYRDLAKAREEGRHYVAGHLVNAILADPPGSLVTSGMPGTSGLPREQPARRNYASGPFGRVT